MNKVKCDVIKDLMPSYLDGICSEASKELVELHISECASCKMLLEEMQKTEFVTNQSDMEQINHMRKVKFAFAQRNITILGLLCAFLVIGMIVTMIHYGSVPTEIYYMILPIVMFAIHLIQSGYAYTENKGKNIKLFLSIATVGVLYVICLQGWSVFLCNTGKFPTWIPINRLGPFCYIQYLIIAIIEMLICISSLLIGAKKDKSYGVVPYVSIISAVLCLVFISIMKRMASAENYLQMVLVPFGIVITEGIVFSCLFVLRNRRK